MGAAHAGSSPTPWPKETTAMKHKWRKKASNFSPPINVCRKHMFEILTRK
jgi:hypothetical protein